jgi:glycosyltransferase 2 family protein
MRELTTKWIVRLGSFAVAAVLLYLALRGVDLTEVGSALKAGNYWWILPLVFVTLFSHWIRAIRWKMLLEVLPEHSDSKRPISTWNTFISIMIGYMANYAGPRLGEVIRTGNVARREKLPFSAVFGTVFIERVLDMAAFGLFVLSVPFIFQAQAVQLWHLLTIPLLAYYAETSSTLIAAIGVGTLVVVVLIGVFVPRILRKPGSKLLRYYAQFQNGFLSLSRARKPIQMTLLTLLMWSCYGLMAYIPFVILGQNLLFNIGPLQAWGIMLIGALGVIIPSPGGIGTFHFVTIQSLGMLFLLPHADAATYALLAHTGQMLLYLLVGTMGILYLGTVPEQLVRGKSKPSAEHE